MNHRRPLALALVAAAALAAGCGDDPAPTTEAYCTSLQALPQGGDPLGDFFREHPDPTLEDWAAVLPEVIPNMRESLDRFAAVEPSAELADEKAAFVGALGTVIENFEQASAAASAGDQARFDELETRNQDENVPAMESAMEAVTGACGLGSE
jgi:hypothetical protein